MQFCNNYAVAAVVSLTSAIAHHDMVIMYMSVYSFESK